MGCYGSCVMPGIYRGLFRMYHYVSFFSVAVVAVVFMPCCCCFDFSLYPYPFILDIIYMVELLNRNIRSRSGHHLNHHHHILNHHLARRRASPRPHHRPRLDRPSLALKRPSAPHPPLLLLPPPPLLLPPHHHRQRMVRPLAPMANLVLPPVAQRLDRSLVRTTMHQKPQSQIVQLR